MSTVSFVEPIFSTSSCLDNSKIELLEHVDLEPCYYSVPGEVVSGNRGHCSVEAQMVSETSQRQLLASNQQISNKGMKRPYDVSFHCLPHLQEVQDQSYQSDPGNFYHLLEHYVNFPMITLYENKADMPPLIANKTVRTGCYRSIPVPTLPTLQMDASMIRAHSKSEGRKRKVIAKRTNFDKGNRSKSETGYRGVRFSTNGCRFRATVNVNKTPFNVGTFDTAQRAAEEYDKALIHITKGKAERSRLNFPMAWQNLYEQVREAATKGEKISHLPSSKRRKLSPPSLQKFT